MNKKRCVDFDKKYEGIRADWQSFQKQPWVPGFKTIRNKITAHLELKVVVRVPNTLIDEAGWR